jgi:hypothetical protein
MPRRTWRAHLGPCLLLLALVTSCLASSEPARAAVADLTIHMPGEAPLAIAGGAPILVAGIWHEVSVNLSAPVGSVAINATLPGAPPEGIRTTYRWTWDAATGTWSDPLYDLFIRPDLSSADGLHLTFVVGLDAQALPGLWRFLVFEGSGLSAGFDVAVEAPVLSYGLSAADFDFQVEPFISTDVSSRPSGQYIRVTNQGNVPLRLAASFDVLQGELSIENPTDVAHVYREARYYVRLAASPRPPAIIEVRGVSRVEALYVVPSSGAATINPSVEGTFSLALRIGRSGYALRVVGNVVFQTLESIRADFGAIATWQVYLTGEQNVSLTIEVSNGRLVGAFAGGQALSFPATLAVSGNTEMPVTVQVQADRPGAASVTFTIHLLTTGDTRTFTTTILVKGGPPALDPTSAFLWILGSIAAALVFGFVSVSQWRAHRIRRAGRVSSALGGRPKRGYNYRRRMRSQRRWNSNGNGGKGKPSQSRGTRTTRFR